MTPPTQTHPMERWVSGLLRAGVWTSAALVSAGLALWLAANPALWTQPDLLPDLLTRHGPTALSPPAPAANAGRFAVLTGLIVLILTPILRVVLSMITFSRAGERAFAWLSAAVLTLLILSVTLGLWWR